MHQSLSLFERTKKNLISTRRGKNQPKNLSGQCYTYVEEKLGRRRFLKKISFGEINPKNFLICFNTVHTFNLFFLILNSFTYAQLIYFNFNNILCSHLFMNDQNNVNGSNVQYVRTWCTCILLITWIS